MSNDDEPNVSDKEGPPVGELEVILLVIGAFCLWTGQDTSRSDAEVLSWVGVGTIGGAVLMAIIRRFRGRP